VPAPRGDAGLAARALPERGIDAGAALQALLGDPNLASRAWVTGQYDATVGGDTVAGPDAGAAVLRVKGTSKALVVSCDANARVGAIDPWLGAALAVAECARNVAVTGARPLGVTNCLNFGDPERPEAFWQLKEGVRGLADACLALGLPVTGGNVSLYNASAGGAIAPTTQVGIVGLLDDVERCVGPAFRGHGDLVAIVGTGVPGLAGSIYAEVAGDAPDDHPPAVDLALEARLIRFLIAGARERLLRSAQDVGGGGIAVALAEAAMWSGTGADVELPVSAPPAVELFGEGPGRVLVSCRQEDLPGLAALAARHDLPFRAIGRTGGDRLRIRLVGVGATGAAEERGAGVADELDEAVALLRHAWDHGLARALGDEDWRSPVVGR
jgi:phosphoribosylformylglycinamidine synthase subunit PurL